MPVRPVRGQLLTSVERRAAAPAMSRRRCYIVPWVDGTVLVGATVEDVGFDERACSRVRICWTPHANWCRTPGSVLEVRVGLPSFTPDDLPILGRSPASPHIDMPAGHYRNGVLLAPLTSAVIADLIVSGREDQHCTLHVAITLLQTGLSEEPPWADGGPDIDQDCRAFTDGAGRRCGDAAVHVR